MRNPQKSVEIVVTITLSIAIWPIAFNLGVYGTVLYPHLFTILSASIALILARWLFRLKRSEQALRGVLPVVLLALPSVWLLVEILLHRSSGSGVEVLRWSLAVATGLLSLPYLAYCIALYLVPGIDEIGNQRNRVKIVAIVLVIAVIAYCSGYYHHYVLSCQDFEVAGSMVPQNCWYAD
ncbi:MAG: hypothetical protein AAF402_04305 [Pseudomonadota bacterium]